MRTLTFVFFAEFALLAMAGPGLTIPFRRVAVKLLLPCLLPIVLTPLLLPAVAWLLPDQPLSDVLQLQVLALSFALAVGGLAALAGRPFPCAGPVLVTLLALALLATPFWGDLLMGIDHDRARAIALRGLVGVNPLFTVAHRLRFDWTHSIVLYRLTRIGEDFSYTPAPLWLQTVVSAGGGLLAALVAGLVRPRGAAGDYLVADDAFC